MVDDLRAKLNEMSRPELDALAQKLSISGFRKLKISELIEQLLLEEKLLRKHLEKTWWDKYHSHCYGVLGVSLAVISILVSIFFSYFQETNDSFKQLRKREIQNKISKITKEGPDIIFEESKHRKTNCRSFTNRF